MCIAFISVLAPPAHACSCVGGDIRNWLESQPAAFVGRLEQVDRSLVGWVTGADFSTRFRFRVERVVKGRIGATIDVWSAGQASSCGLSVRRGQRVGLILQRSEGRWTGSSCSQYVPDALLTAAEPLPVLDGDGPIRSLRFGKWGEARLAAADAQGRTLAYGWGPGMTTSVAVCPGSVTALEVVTEGLFVERLRTRLVRRDLRTFSTTEPELLDERVTHVDDLVCADPDGSRYAVVASTATHAPTAMLVRSNGRTVELPSGAHDPALHPSGSVMVYVRGRTSLRELDISTGESRTVAEVPPGVASMMFGPDGGQVAFTYGAPNVGADHVGLFDRATGEVRVASLGVAGSALWATNTELVVSGVGAHEQKIVRRLGLDLRPLTPWTPAPAPPTAAAGGLLYGINEGQVFAGPSETDMHPLPGALPTTELERIVAVPPSADGGPFADRAKLPPLPAGIGPLAPVGGGDESPGVSWRPLVSGGWRRDDGFRVRGRRVSACYAWGPRRAHGRPSTRSARVAEGLRRGSRARHRLRDTRRHPAEAAVHAHRLAGP